MVLTLEQHECTGASSEAWVYRSKAACKAHLDIAKVLRASGARIYELWSKLLKRVIWGNIYGSIMGFTRVDTRSLDYSSYESYEDV